jgi:hypothetical protein
MALRHDAERESKLIKSDTVVAVGRESVIIDLNKLNQKVKAVFSPKNHFSKVVTSSKDFSRPSVTTPPRIKRVLTPIQSSVKKKIKENNRQIMKHKRVYVEKNYGTDGNFIEDETDWIDFAEIEEFDEDDHVKVIPEVSEISDTESDGVDCAKDYTGDGVVDGAIDDVVDGDVDVDVEKIHLNLKGLTTRDRFFYYSKNCFPEMDFGDTSNLGFD